MAGKQPRASLATKFNPEVRNRVLEALRAGNTRTSAAAYAGITPQTFCGWLRKGRKKGATKEFQDFLTAVQKAEADAIIRNVATIQKAAQKQWQAAAWWLERKFPEEWGALRGTIAELRARVKALEGGSGRVDPQPPVPPPA